MKLVVKCSDVKNQHKTCLVVGVFEDGTLTSAAASIDQATNHALRNWLKQGKFGGKSGQILSLYQFSPAFDHVLLAGCGKNTKNMSVGTFRQIIIASMKSLMDSGVKQATCYLSELPIEDRTTAWKIKYLAEVISEASYLFDQFKSDKAAKPPLKEIILAFAHAKDKKACEAALKQGSAIAEAVTYTKNLANLPSNICTPTYLAEQAKTLADSHPNMTIHVLEEKDMEKLGMGAFLGVTKGTAEKAKLICLEYQGISSSHPSIALVGKGITFDTGGISLKPADSMVGMKYDMCGAATVMGTLKAAAELKLPLHLVGLIAAAENMPGGHAYKPEDILTTMSGQTVEVISTDAEGRLVLCDTLTYCERYKPKVVIDIATLTGAVVVALGNHATGLIANDEKLAKDLLHAGQESFDRAWQLPLWEEYQEQIKSPFADMVNAGSRSAGTITAGCFLSRFTKKFAWAHLDVAGTAAQMAGVSERMATGRPVPLLMQYLINQTKSSASKNK